MRTGACGGGKINGKFKNKFSKSVDNMAGFEYNISEERPSTSKFSKLRE